MSDGELGKLIDQRFEILSRVGEDEFTITYKVKHRLMGKFVLLKILKPERAGNPGDVERFQQGWQASDINPVQDAPSMQDCGVTESGRPYLVVSLPAEGEKPTSSAPPAKGGLHRRRTSLLTAGVVLSLFVVGVGIAWFCSTDDGRIILLRTEIGMRDGLEKQDPDRLRKRLEELATLYQKKGEYVEAAGQITRLISMTGTSTPAEQAARGVAFEKRGDLYSLIGDKQSSLRDYVEGHKNLYFCVSKLINSGNFKEIVPTSESMVRTARKIGAMDGTDWCDDLQIQGESYFGMGMIDPAEPIAKEALQLARKRLSSDSRRLARMKVLRASVYIYKGQLQDAEKLLLDALSGAERNIVELDTVECIIYSNLGAVYTLEGKHSEALDMLRRARAHEVDGTQSIRNVLLTHAKTFSMIGKDDQARKLVNVWFELKPQP